MAKDKPLEPEKPLDWNLTVEALKDLRDGRVEDAMAALRAAQELQQGADRAQEGQ